jgi:hypothetical protein
MALVPGTLTTAENIYPAAPQTLLNTFASKLTAPPSKKALFSQSSSTNIPIDGSALWHNTLDNTIRAFSSSQWRSLLGQNLVSNEYNNTATIDGSTASNRYAAGSAPTSPNGAVLVSSIIRMSSTTNRVEGRISIPIVAGRVGSSAGNAVMVVAIFKDSDTTAFQTGVLTIPAHTEFSSFAMSFSHAPVALGNVTYTVRVGVGGANASTTILGINRTIDSASAVYAATGKVSLQLEERHI